MTDSDDNGPSSSNNSSSDYATIDEVAAELARLSALALEKIEAKAIILVSGTSLDPGDLLHTVLERLLTRDRDRRRHWHRKETLADCIYRTMRSIIRDYWRREQLGIVPISAAAAGHPDVPDPETQLIAHQELGSVLSALDDANNTSDIALALASGRTPAEVKLQFGLTETAYDSALKRIRRRLTKYKAAEGKA
jgi:DNA-directed RNA polymerase specialized sigma24 family protein